MGSRNHVMTSSKLKNYFFLGQITIVPQIKAKSVSSITTSYSARRTYLFFAIAKFASLCFFEKIRYFFLFAISSRFASLFFQRNNFRFASLSLFDFWRNLYLFNHQVTPNRTDEFFTCKKERSSCDNRHASEYWNIK